MIQGKIYKKNGVRLSFLTFIAKVLIRTTDVITPCPLSYSNQHHPSLGGLVNVFYLRIMIFKCIGLFSTDLPHPLCITLVFYAADG